ncbi:MAG: sulfotransferase [Mycobacteriales bacterium]
MPPQPLFLFGVAQRTGTHYLSALLELHPRCVPISVPPDEKVSRPEDHLLDRAAPLLHYVQHTQQKWHPGWGLGEDADEVLLEELVDAIGRFVVRLGTRSLPPGDQPTYVLTKTPATNNLRLLVRCKPDLPVLVIARDGRDVVESSHKAWGLSYERWTRVWSEGVDQLAAAQEIDGKGSIKVVRYEDLLTDLRRTLEPVFEHLGLSTDDYDWDAAMSLPVRGSSYLQAQRKDISWTPTLDTDGVIGQPRWQSWPRARLSRFGHLAGAQMAHLGYAMDRGRSLPAVEPVRDAAWNAARLARRARDRVKGAP